MAKKRIRTSVKSAPRKRTKTLKARRIPKELEDNPKLRYQKLSEDQFRGTPEKESLAKFRAAAVEDTFDQGPVNETPMTPATPGGSNWVQLGPLAIANGQTYGGARVIVTGRVTGIAVDPTDANNIYVAAARGGVWKTGDGGVTWAPTSDNAASLAIGALAIAPSAPLTLYAGTGEGNIYYYRITYPGSSINETYNGNGILKSTDGAVTWTIQGSAAFTGACFYRIAVHPTDPNTAFAASNKGLFRTTDGGGTWVQLTQGLPSITLLGPVIATTDVVFDPSTPATVYVAFWGSGIYKTTNAAAANPSWTKLAGGLPTASLGRISIGISATAPLRVYALIANSGDSLIGLYASPDGGSTWSSIAAATAVVSLYGAYTANVAVDVSTPDVLYVSGVSLYKAVRTAGVWSVIDIGSNIHPDNHALCGHPTNHLVIYAGTDGGVYKSSDGGATWTTASTKGSVSRNSNSSINIPLRTR